jgi:Protein of unknown function (DUF1778)
MDPITEIRESDAKGRFTLPKQFANSTFLLEIVSDVEIRLRKAKVVPLETSEGGSSFAEEEPVNLASADAETFFAALDHPPAPGESLKKLMRGK